MAFKPIFRFRNSDSTRDLNTHYASGIEKGIYTGGDLFISPSTLTVSVQPFTAVGFDGMVVVSDAPVILTVPDRQDSLLVLFAKYELGADPLIELSVKDRRQVVDSSLEDYYLIFARIDLSRGGYTGLVYETAATIPGNLGQVVYNGSDYADKIGQAGLRSSVPSVLDLPTLKNNDGDVRYAVANKGLYGWRSLDKIWINLLSAEALNINYSGGAVWADGTPNPPTSVEGQLDKIVTDLALGNGSGKIAVPALAGSPTSPAANNLTNTLKALVAAINERGLLNADNTWLGVNTFSNNATFTGAQTTIGKLSVTGQVNLASTLTVVGTTTLAALTATSITSYGAVDLQAGANVTGALNVSGVVTAGGLRTNSGTLFVGGKSTLSDLDARNVIANTFESISTVRVGSAAVPADILSARDIVTIRNITQTGALSVAGYSTLAGGGRAQTLLVGDATPPRGAAYTLQVNGDINIVGKIYLSGTLFNPVINTNDIVCNTIQVNTSLTTAAGALANLQGGLKVGGKIEQTAGQIAQLGNTSTGTFSATGYSTLAGAYASTLLVGASTPPLDSRFKLQVNGDFNVNGVIHLNGTVFNPTTGGINTAIITCDELTVNKKSVFNGAQGATFNTNISQISGTTSLTTVTVQNGLTVSAGNVAINSGNLSVSGTINSVNINSLNTQVDNMSRAFHVLVKGTPTGYAVQYPNRRYLNEGTNITFGDGGAGGNLTINASHGTQGGGTAHTEATQNSAGFLSTANWGKLNNLADNANAAYRGMYYGPRIHWYRDHLDPCPAGPWKMRMPLWEEVGYSVPLLGISFVNEWQLTVTLDGMYSILWNQKCISDVQSGLVTVSSEVRVNNVVKLRGGQVTVREYYDSITIPCMGFLSLKNGDKVELWCYTFNNVGFSYGDFYMVREGTES